MTIINQIPTWNKVQIWLAPHHLVQKLDAPSIIHFFIFIDWRQLVNKV